MSKKDHNQRPATQADVDDGKAVYWIPESRSTVYDLGFSLPAQAVTRKSVECSEGEEPIPAGTSITVIQAEIVDNSDILIGFTFGQRQGVCALDEIEFLV